MGVTANSANTVGQWRQQLKWGVKVLEAAKPHSQHPPSPGAAALVYNFMLL